MFKRFRRRGSPQSRYGAHTGGASSNNIVAAITYIGGQTGLDSQPFERLQQRLGTWLMAIGVFEKDRDVQVLVERAQRESPLTKLPALRCYDPNEVPACPKLGYYLLDASKPANHSVVVSEVEGAILREKFVNQVRLNSATTSGEV